MVAQFNVDTAAELDAARADSYFLSNLLPQYCKDSSVSVLEQIRQDRERYEADPISTETDTDLAALSARADTALLDVQFCEFTGSPPSGGSWYDYLLSCVDGKTVSLCDITIAARGADK